MSNDLANCKGYEKSTKYYYCINEGRILCNSCNDRHTSKNCNTASIELSESYYICDDFIQLNKETQKKYTKGICDLNIPKRKCNKCNQTFCLFTFNNKNLSQNDHLKIHEILYGKNDEDSIHLDKSEKTKEECKSTCHQEKENSIDDKKKYDEYINLFSGDEFFHTQIIFDILKNIDRNEKSKDYDNLLKNYFFFTDEKFIFNYLIKSNEKEYDNILIKENENIGNKIVEAKNYFFSNILK
jgi:hypothetical protein